MLAKIYYYPYYLESLSSCSKYHPDSTLTDGNTVSIKTPSWFPWKPKWWAAWLTVPPLLCILTFSSLWGYDSTVYAYIVSCQEKSLEYLYPLHPHKPLKTLENLHHLFFPRNLMWLTGSCFFKPTPPLLLTLSGWLSRSFSFHVNFIKW